MDEVGCLVGQVELLVSQLKGSVMLVDISGVKKIYRRINFWDNKLCLKGLLVFQVPIHCIFLVEHDPI